MSESKVDKLKLFLEQRPDDPFPRYGLAMEYRRLDQAAEAIEMFQDLLDRFPNYSAAYYHFGMTLLSAGSEARAREVLRRGIQVTAGKGETHAREELEAALAELES